MKSVQLNDDEITALICYHARESILNNYDYSYAIERLRYLNKRLNDVAVTRQPDGTPRTEYKSPIQGA